MSDGMRALLLEAGSAVAGAVYYLYVVAEPFPHDLARVVPIVWLVGAVLGGVVAAHALRTGSRVTAVLALALTVPNTIVAAIFSIAALMGD